jgi:drug/metabolite transporter (DMT)-like permease
MIRIVIFDVTKSRFVLSWTTVRCGRANDKMGSSALPLRDWSLLLITAAAFATSLPFNKILVAEISPLTLAASRAALAFPVVWLISTVARRGLPFSRAAWQTSAIAAVFVVVVPFSAIAWGQQSIPSGMGGILYAMMPLFTVIIAHFLVRDEPISLWKLAGIAMGIAGVVSIIGPKVYYGAGSSIAGEIVTLIAPASYALGNVLLRRRPAVDPLELTTAMLLLGAVILVPLSLIVEGTHPSFKWNQLYHLLGLALIGTAAPAFLNYLLVRTAGATRASLVMFLLPVFAVAFGTALLGETINGPMISGMCLVIVGSMIVTRSTQTGPPRAGGSPILERP